MRKIIVSLLIIVVLLSAVSCSGNTNTASSEKHEILNIEQLSAGFDKLLSNSSKTSKVDKDYVSMIMGIELNNVEDYIVKIQTAGNEADMYGIFLIKDGAGETVVKQVNDYIDQTRRNFADFNYMPGENVKIERAKAIANGKYVMFVVAPQAEQESVNDFFLKNT